VQQRSLQAGSALSRVRSAAAREREALAGRKQHWQAAALPLCAAQPKHAPAQPVPGPGCRAPVSQRGRARASCQVRHRVTAKPRGHTLFFCPVAACASQQAGALLPRCASDLHGAAGTGSSATPRRRLELTSASRPAARRTKPKGAVRAAPAVRKPAPAGQEGADATDAGSVALLQVHTLPTCSDIGSRSRSLFAPPPARLGHCLVCGDEKVMLVNPGMQCIAWPEVGHLLKQCACNRTWCPGPTDRHAMARLHARLSRGVSQHGGSAPRRAWGWREQRQSACWRARRPPRGGCLRGCAGHPLLRRPASRERRCQPGKGRPALCPQYVTFNPAT